MRRVSAIIAGLVACGPSPTAGDGGSGTESTAGDHESSGSGGAVDGATNDDAAADAGGSTGTATDAGDSTTLASTSASDGDDTGGGFVHEVHTVLTEDGRLALQSNLPRLVDACLALDADAPCDDVDADGLTDAWEDAALERMRPLRRFDEAEMALQDADAVMADVGRVAPSDDGSVRLYVMLGYSRDYGSCGGLTSHDGDSERVALALHEWSDGGPGGVSTAQAYTAAHENTVNDHGRVFANDDLAMLVFAPDPVVGEPRWVVFPSANKHATYATIEVCEAISAVPCLDEDCGPELVRDPSAFDLLPVAVNAGEADTPRVEDLAVVGFPGDDAWADQDFCGGLRGGTCSASVRSKLLDDPFGE